MIQTLADVSKDVSQTSLDLNATNVMLAFMEKCAAFRAMVAKTAAVIETELAKKVARLILIENVNIASLGFTVNFAIKNVLSVAMESVTK